MLLRETQSISSAIFLLPPPQFPSALDFLDKNSTVIVDKLAVSETKVEILLQLERRGEALAILWDLLDRNPENKKYYTQLEEAIQPGESAFRREVFWASARSVSFRPAFLSSFARKLWLDL